MIDWIITYNKILNSFILKEIIIKRIITVLNRRQNIQIAFCTMAHVDCFIHATTSHVDMSFKEYSKSGPL